MSFLDPLVSVPSEFLSWLWTRITEFPQFLRDAPAKALRDDLFAALVLAFVVFVRFRAAWFSLQPVRTAYRRPLFRSGMQLGWRQRRTLRRELLRALRHSQRSIRAPEIAQTCSSIRVAVWMTHSRYKSAPLLVAPHKCDIVTDLHLVVAKSLEPSNSNIITRFLVSARWEEHAEYLREIDAYLKQFSALSPVAVRDTADSAEAQPSFADTISAATGAVVLADLTIKNTALSTTSIAVWHERIWFGAPLADLGEQKDAATDPIENEEAAKKEPETGTAEQEIPDDRGGNPSTPRPNGVQKLPPSLMSPYEIAASKLTDSVVAATKRLGSFNGRVPILLRAEVTRSLGLEEPILILVTGETDYNATEERKKSAVQDDVDTPRISSDIMAHRPRACKKLPFLSSNFDFSSYYPIKFGDTLYSGSTSSLYSEKSLTIPKKKRGSRKSDRVVAPANPSRAYQLNGKVTFICRTEGKYKGFDAFVVLMNRSMSNENGFGIAATTAGGALSLPVPKGLADGNRFGALDPIPGIQREISEELGLKEHDYSISVHAVVQHNSRPDPSITSPLNPLNGEMTATCLAIAHTSLHPDEMKAKRFAGSASMGLAEADGLIAIPLGNSADEFHNIATRGRYCTKCSDFWHDGRVTLDSYCVDPTGHKTKLLRDNVEQMALVSMAYCSGIIHGVNTTKSAWGQNALWSTPFGIDGEAYARVCVDPANLYKSERFEKVLKALLPEDEYIDELGKVNGRKLR